MHRAATIVFVLLAAACGGTSTPAAAPANKGAADAPALPFDQAAVQATLGAAPANDACGEGGETFAALMQRQGAALGDASTTDVSFACRPGAADDHSYECWWSVFAKPVDEPSPDDPCGGECCSGFQVMVVVQADGSFDPASAICVAPG